MLATGRNREQERAAQQQMMSRIISRYNRSIAREIARAMNDYARNLDDPMVSAEVRFRHMDNMSRILTRLWTQSGKMSVEHNFNIVKAYYDMETKKGENFPDLTTPIVDKAIADWIRAYGGGKITEITGTTMTDINKIVADAREQGLSERDTAKLINAVAPVKSASRSQTIARTEAHGSSQGISLDVANETDIPLVKVWLSDQGESAREDHLDVNGQKRALADDFSVGGEQLEYPGSPSGNPENVINCKCVIGYELA
jgi:hypothetical protein